MWKIQPQYTRKYNLFLLALVPFLGYPCALSWLLLCLLLLALVPFLVYFLACPLFLVNN
jgi:hypothetical protein